MPSTIFLLKIFSTKYKDLYTYIFFLLRYKDFTICNKRFYNWRVYY